MVVNLPQSWKIVIIISALIFICGCVDNSYYSDPNPKPTFQQIFDTPGGSRHSYNNHQYSSRNTEFRYHKWAPPAQLEGSRRWDGIMIHHSATDFGDAATFDRSHRGKGWDELGYHFVIDNGRNSNGKSDGLVEVGSRWNKQKHGAHCRVSQSDDNYWNEHYIGICLVGNFEKRPPSEAQYRALRMLVGFLKDRYNIPKSKIIGHKHADKGTLCPGRFFNWQIANL